MGRRWGVGEVLGLFKCFYSTDIHGLVEGVAILPIVSLIPSQRIYSRNVVSTDILCMQINFS